MKYWIKTFGCQMNKSDSERISSVLNKSGYKPVQKIEEADLAIINMCSVRQSPVDRVYGLVPKLKNKQSLLTGCVLNKDKRKLSKIFDFILDIESLSKWPEIITGKKIISGKDIIKVSSYLKIRPCYDNRFSANIPIMTGCNNYCSYCVVPSTRGEEISRPVEDIVSEAQNLAEKGYKEIWLLGQNVNSYNKIPFADLLRKINNIPGNFWIRFTSSNPKDFSENTIKAIKDSKKITEYLNLPAQSGDNEILKKMNRPYTVEEYKKIIKKTRKEIPNITLSTDIIVGFPGETKEQFKNTAKLFKEIEYDMAYIAKYSPRPQTKAAQMKDNVPQKEKNRREKVLTDILKKTALKNNKEYIGKEIDVLLSAKTKDGWTGKSRKYKTVKVFSNKNLLGEFVKVKITEAFPWGLKGEIKSYS